MPDIDPTQTLHYRLKQAAVLVVQGLALPKIGTKNVYNLRMQNTTTVDWAKINLPGVVIDTGGAGETEEWDAGRGGATGTSSTFQEEWPLRALILARISEKEHDQEPWILYWRNEIKNAFRSRASRPCAFAGLANNPAPEAQRITVRPGPIFLPAEVREGLMLTISVLNLRVLTSQTRPTQNNPNPGD